MNEELYNKIVKLVFKGLKSSDEDERELAIDLAKAAVKYTDERASWNWLTLEERDANDGARTRIHNRMIDCFRIFLRYENKAYGVEEIDIDMYDRKTIGDIGNRLTAELAMAQR